MTSSALAAQEIQSTQPTDDNIEVIQVTGILNSMKAAALLKRTDDRIVDAVVAEDIGNYQTIILPKPCNVLLVYLLILTLVWVIVFRFVVYRKTGLN